MFGPSGFSTIKSIAAQENSRSTNEIVKAVWKALKKSPQNETSSSVVSGGLALTIECCSIVGLLINFEP